ncbi:MAG: RNA ligase partner protein [Candidatus Roizmanbacteria bacterium]
MKYCIDTNIFFSFEIGIDLGKNPLEVMGFLSKARAASPTITYLMTPSIVAEMETMFEIKDKAALHSFLSNVSIKTPPLGEMTVPAMVFDQFISEGRKRSGEGLHIADETLVRAVEAAHAKPALSRIDIQKSLQQPKESLRSRYRNATRTGYLDSSADFGLIMLALHENATLITADEGVALWGQKLGVGEMSGAVFGHAIRQAAGQ